MVAHHQGSLDGYCGIYCIINAISLMVPDLNCEDLFAKIIKHIGNKLARMTLNGITLVELKDHVIKTTMEYLIDAHQIELSYNVIEDGVSLDEYWTILQDHYEKNGSGSIVLGMVGVREHWTCVKKVHRKTIEFADSDSLKCFYRSYITLGEPTKKRKHVLIPSETFLLSIKDKA